MKEYLGDSVYCEFDGESVILTTENGLPGDPSNCIFMDLEVLAAFLAFINRTKLEGGSNVSGATD